MMYQSCEQVSLPYSYRKRQTDQVYNRSAESAIVEEGFAKFYFRSLVFFFFFFFFVPHLGNNIIIIIIT